MTPHPAPEREAVQLAVDRVVARAVLVRMRRMIDDERQLAVWKRSLTRYLLLAFAIFFAFFVFTGAVVDRARELAPLLGSADVRPVTLGLALGWLAFGFITGACSAYPLIWRRDPLGRRCLVAAVAALGGALLIYASPELVRLALPSSPH